MDSIISREAEIAKIAKSADRMAALQKHLKEITQGKAFKGSLRSAQFLTYIVEQAIAGNFDLLKERVIGVEIFQRSPSYDTGEDAIVRVTASDVRKRLLQHYDRYGAASDIHISLPLGSYIPEIRWDHAIVTVPLDSIIRHQDAPSTPPLSSVDQDPALAPKTAKEAAANAPSTADLETSRFYRPSQRRWLSVTVPLAALNLALLGVLLYGIQWQRSVRTETAPPSANPLAPVRVLPWSTLFSSPNPTHLITSDPDIYWIQTLTRSPISISDYANHVYIPEGNTLTPEMKKVCLGPLRGDKAATVDTQIAINVESLAQSSSRRIDVQGARSIQFSTLKTDDNFVFLGSMRSDPWVSLFNDQLDFRFVIQKGSMDEIFSNVHPKPNEQPFYAQTAKTGGTGESFAIIALVRNPNQDGQVLLLAGLNAEGTQAAGRLATDLPRLSTALQNCGIAPFGLLKHFEMLLRVRIMASSPSEFEVMACRILPDPAAH